MALYTIEKGGKWVDGHVVPCWHVMGDRGRILSYHATLEAAEQKLAKLEEIRLNRPRAKSRRNRPLSDCIPW
jgi:hypothetical protein